jgi:hypothetical protein
MQKSPCSAWQSSPPAPPLLLPLPEEPPELPLLEPLLAPPLDPLLEPESGPLLDPPSAPVGPQGSATPPSPVPPRWLVVVVHVLPLEEHPRFVTATPNATTAA